MTVGFLVAIVWLELIARIVGPKDGGPYLVALTAAEPEPELEREIYARAGLGE